MLEAAMIWNEPNNKSLGTSRTTPAGPCSGQMAKLAGEAIAAEAPGLPRVLGGISPIDPDFIRVLQGNGGLDALDAVAVHGFPLDWNHWMLSEWPAKLDTIRAVTRLPVWVSEVGISTFGAEEVQEWGLRRTAELLRGQAPRIHWYSLYDLPAAWPATTRHREAGGQQLLPPFPHGPVRRARHGEAAARIFHEFAPELGICQWFHFEDHRLDDAVRKLKDLGVTTLRTGLSWADWYRPNAEAWFDRQMRALEDFQVTATFCFTPEHKGRWPHYTAVPANPEEFAEFCAAMVRRYGAGPGRCVGFSAGARVVLARLAARQTLGCRIALVAAHPDDETIAAGGSLRLMPSLLLVHVTDGAPRHLPDAAREGFASPEAYGEAREAELQAALAVAGVAPERIRLGVPDQGATDAVPGIVAALVRAFAAHGTQAVLTHAYEGGHPDHDATALAAHAAARRAGLPVFEFAGYHAGPEGSMQAQRFLPGPAETRILLDPLEAARKQAMFDCFVTQRAILGAFDPGVERFRPAPRYDFTLPPHEGPLNYENWGWDLTGAAWRARARALLAGSLRPAEALQCVP